MARPLTPEDLWRIPRVGAPVVSPDGSFLVVPVGDADLEANRIRTRLWLIPTDGSAARPLTSKKVDAKAPAISPDGGRLAFTRKDENDQLQLWVLPLEGGEPDRITDLPIGVLGSKWLPDGSGLVVLAEVFREALTVEAARQRATALRDDPVRVQVTEDRTNRYWDVWLTDGRVPHLFVVPAGGGEPRDLIPDSTRWWLWPSTDDPVADFDIAPDGSEVAFAADVSEPPHAEPRWALFTVPVSGGEVRCLTPGHTGHDRRPRYSPDGRWLAFGMQRRLDFYADRVRIVVIDRHSDDEVVLTEDWDAAAAGWEFDAAGDLVLVAERRGRQPLYRMSLEPGEPEMVIENHHLSDLAPAADGSIYLLRQSLRQPPEVVRWSGSGIEPVTGFTDPALEEIEMGEVEEIEVPGATGTPIQVLLVQPPGFDPSVPRPLVHLVHGGPHGTFGDSWHWRWCAHAFAAPGYLVALVNFHGSTSFGEAFTTSIHGAWGDKPFADVMAATDHLVERGLVDPDHMAVAGGSYGGYLTSWIIGQTDRFACAVAHAAVTDLPAMYASDWNNDFALAFGSTPWENLEAVLRWSPLASTAGMTTPTLVVHGSRDYRVPVTQGLSLYGLLKAKGVQARLVHYPDENHWVLSPRNSLHWYGEVLGWLERFIGKEHLRSRPDPTNGAVLPSA